MVSLFSMTKKTKECLEAELFRMGLQKEVVSDIVFAPDYFNMDKNLKVLQNTFENYVKKSNSKDPRLKFGDVFSKYFRAQKNGTVMDVYQASQLMRKTGIYN